MTLFFQAIGVIVAVVGGLYVALRTGGTQTKRFVLFQVVSFLVVTVWHIHINRVMYRALLEAWFEAAGAAELLVAVVLGLITWLAFNWIEKMLKATDPLFAQKRKR